jgi:hypothetical protein
MMAESQTFSQGRAAQAQGTRQSRSRCARKSGDAHLRNLKTWHSTRIVSTTEAVALIAKA